eukprot:9061821-Karenia_brevis.AAC.1
MPTSGCVGEIGTFAHAWTVTPDLKLSQIGDWQHIYCPIMTYSIMHTPGWQAPILQWSRHGASIKVNFQTPAVLEKFRGGQRKQIQIAC